MTTQPDYLKYLESAKQAELAQQLSNDGYVVEKQKSINGVVFDLLATRNGQTTAYEFKSAGHSRSSRDQLMHLQKVAAEQGYRFRIVVAVPPPRVEVEVDDLNEQLLDYLINHIPGALDSLSSHTIVEGVEDVSISSISIGAGNIHLAGSASVSVTLQYGGSSDNTTSTDAFPFTFSAILDSDGKLNQVGELEVDITAFYD